MKHLWLLGIIALSCVLGVGRASADTLQLRNGRHLQGKYLGGTTAMIGFMSSGGVEYFATADVLALIFDNNDTPLSGVQPNPMKAPDVAKHSRIRKVASQPGIHRPQLRVAEIRATDDSAPNAS